MMYTKSSPSMRLEEFPKRMQKAIAKMEIGQKYWFDEGQYLQRATQEEWTFVEEHYTKSYQERWDDYLTNPTLGNLP
jgi:hypothetical protein